MAQSSQSTPTVTANISDTNHQVNLRDYLNIRVAPFIKKAITESLDASPEFPLQWLGENLIHQSMLYEGNPDSTKIRERFVYKFDTPVVAPAVVNAPVEAPAQPQPATVSSADPVAITNGGAVPDPIQAQGAQDTALANHVNGSEETTQIQQEEGSRDTEMEGTS